MALERIMCYHHSQQGRLQNFMGMCVQLLHCYISFALLWVGCVLIYRVCSKETVYVLSNHSRQFIYWQLKRYAVTIDRRRARLHLARRCRHTRLLCIAVEEPVSFLFTTKGYCDVSNLTLHTDWSPCARGIPS